MHRIARIKNERLKFGEFVGDDLALLSDPLEQQEPSQISQTTYGPNHQTMVMPFLNTQPWPSAVVEAQWWDAHTPFRTLRHQAASVDASFQVPRKVPMEGDTCYDELVDAYRHAAHQQAEFSVRNPAARHRDFRPRLGSLQSHLPHHRSQKYTVEEMDQRDEAVESAARTKLEVYQKLEINQRGLQLAMARHNPQQYLANEQERNRSRMEWRTKEMVQQSLLMRAQSDVHNTKRLVAMAAAQGLLPLSSGARPHRSLTGNDAIVSWERTRRSRCQIPMGDVGGKFLEMVSALCNLEQEKRKEIELLELTRLDALARIMRMVIQAGSNKNTSVVLHDANCLI